MNDHYPGFYERLEGREFYKHGRKMPPFRITPENKQAIFDLDEHLTAMNLHRRTRYIYVYALALLADGSEKPFGEMSQKDILECRDRMEKDGMAETTRQNYIMKIRFFYKWRFGNNRTFPACVADVSGSVPKKKKTRADLLTKEEVNALINSASNSRDRCLIAMLADSGIRREEAAKCLIGHIEFFPEGYGIVSIPEAKGKTSYQAILDWSVPYIKQWLNEHPNRDRDNRNTSPLFISLGDGNYGKPMGGQALLQIVKRTAKLAGIKGKRIHPHIFRHTSATFKAKEGYSAEEINILQGRKQGSEVAQDYIHLAGGDVVDKFKLRKGYASADPEAAILVKNKDCWKCGESNPDKNLFCFKCQAPLRGSERFKEVANAVDMFEKFKNDDYMERIIVRLKEMENVMLKKMEEKPQMKTGVPGGDSNTSSLDHALNELTKTREMMEARKYVSSQENSNKSS